MKKISRRALLPFLLLMAYAGLIFNLPSLKTVLWFSFAASIAIAYSFLCFFRREREYSFETLSSFGLIIAGGIQFMGYSWLHILYMPYLVTIARFYTRDMVIMSGFIVLILEVKHFIHGDMAEEISFNLVTILVGLGASIIISRLKDELARTRESLKEINEEAKNIDFGAGIDVMSDASQRLSSKLKGDEEMKEILSVIKQLLSADSVGIFVLQDDHLRLRCSVEGADGAVADNDGLLISCFRKKEAVMSSISSLMAAPIIDGNYVIGVLAARGMRPKTFKMSDLRTLEMFARQILTAFRRERINAQITRDHSGLKLMHEGSSKLITSLKAEVIIKRLVEVLHKVAPVRIFFLIPEGDKYEFSHHIGFAAPNERIFDIKDIKNTLLSDTGMLQENKKHFYLSDLRDNRRKVLPFQTNGRILSILIFHLMYEKEPLGILVFFSERVNALSSYQIELLETLVNQATTSIVNAKLYSKIEKLSITDGLTGLFNHKHFQDRLSEEFMRLNRSSESFSLLLIDIDFFKKVNDTYGHPAGDEILRGVAAIIKETIRDIDIPARYGGEEFAAILLKTDNNGAEKMAERLRKAVTGKTFKVDGKDLRVTVSIGIAVSKTDASNKQELIEKADKALYYAKENGRNRCVLYKEIK